MSTHSKNKRIVKKIARLLSFFLVLAIAATATYYVTKKSPVTASSYTKGDVTNDSSTIVKGSASSNSGSVSGSPTVITAPTSPTLLPPSGDFVSDHSPNLSGSPHPNTITSVCSTTPGATCSITFTQNGIVKSLPQQVVDAGGGTYWTWSLQSIGLTTGTWKVEAIATLNGQTQTAYDAMDLTVSP